MCGKKLKRIAVLVSLFLLSFFLPFLSLSYAEVRLTDQEAQQLMTELQESKKDLKELQTQLQDVKKDCEEQKTFYVKQLNEAEQKNKTLKSVASATGASSAVLLVVTVLLIVF